MEENESNVERNEYHKRTQVIFDNTGYSTVEETSDECRSS